MLHLERREITNVKELHASLLGAIRLELATIPPYLTALYSIKHGTNVVLAELIRSVAIEEMLHFCLVCNILNAVGGHPTINTPGFMPKYPGPLPMGIGNEPGRQFHVPLKKASRELLQDVFMVIEQPEEPLQFPVVIRFGTAQDYHTIGAFYEALRRAIREFGESIFTGDPKLQVTGWFESKELFAVTDVETASDAIQIIIDQGEGTTTDPFDLEGKCAHYYRFSECVKGHRLEVNPNVPQGYSYSGEPVPFDPRDIYPMVDNPPLVRLPPRSLVARYANQFDETFTTLLNALHETVNGHPEKLDAVMGLMYALRLQAQQLMETPIPGMRHVTAGPRWRTTYVRY